MQYILGKDLKIGATVFLNLLYCLWHAAVSLCNHLSHLCIKRKGNKNLDYFLFPEIISYIMTVQILQLFAVVLATLIFSLDKGVLS